MSARDDYPYFAALGVDKRTEQYDAMADEIDELRAEIARLLTTKAGL